MTAADVPQTQHHQRDPGTVVRIGSWLFERRTWLPVPLALLLLLIRTGEAPTSTLLSVTGVAVVALGEALRLWGVHHIGVISRTRSDRLGPLIASGPFALVRNPLYLGNIALWVGFALSARLVWMAPLLAAALALEYHAIVRWEEALLESRLGDSYRAYMASVPRWIPTLHHGRETLHHGGHGVTNARDLPSVSSVTSVVERFSWHQTLFSERGTLIAIVVGYALVWIKLMF